MIVLDRVSYVANVAGAKRTVLAPVSLGIPSDRRIALLGFQETDKRIVINLLAGVVQPTTGRILRKARVSFPTGHTGAFSAAFSVRSNVEYVARLYGANVGEVVGFVERAMSLGAAFDEPYARLPNPVKKIFAYVVACSIPFDVYLLNALAGGGAGELKRVADALFEERLRTSGIIVATRDAEVASRYCEMALVVHGDRIALFDDVPRALSALRRAKKRGQRKRNGA